ncbi:MAG TPA: hypothetical protein VMI10_26235 [Terriglobales bacterium]|nr:hypothetical protein [Terriglobales bacterium]
MDASSQSVPERLDGVIRSLQEPEKRSLRAMIGRAERKAKDTLPRHLLYSAIFAIGVLVIISVIAKIARPGEPFGPYWPGAIWIGICELIAVWVFFSAKRESSARLQKLKALSERNEAREIRVQASEVVEFEEIQDEGACFAFQLQDDRILFISGQSYYASKRFPNSDFSLICVYDSEGSLVEEWTRNHGHRLQPIRVVPSDVKAGLSIPDHLEVIHGKLAELEGILISMQSN